MLSKLELGFFLKQYFGGISAGTNFRLQMYLLLQDKITQATFQTGFSITILK
jgi:hypothetical protein